MKVYDVTYRVDYFWTEQRNEKKELELAILELTTRLKNILQDEDKRIKELETERNYFKNIALNKVDMNIILTENGIVELPTYEQLENKYLRMVEAVNTCTEISAQRVDTINAIREIVEEVYEGQPNTLSDRIYYGAKWDKIKNLLSNTPSTPTEEEVLNEVYDKLDIAIENNDIRIYDFMSVTPMKHNSIRQLQIENGAYYKMKVLIEEILRKRVE